MKKNNIHIEKASINEANIILEIQKEAFLGQAKIYNNFNLPPLTQNLESIRSDFNKKTFLKASTNNKIIASVRFGLHDGKVTIDRLVVKPKYHNCGIGTALLKEVESRASGASVFQLFTGSKSRRNIHLYNKIGYKTIYTEITDQGIELLHMEKAIKNKIQLSAKSSANLERKQ